MIVPTGKRFLKNNVYIFRRHKKKPTYMACIMANKEHACFVPINGKGEECEENCYTLDMDKPEVLTNDISFNSGIDIERYGYFGDGVYWSYESV